MLRQSAFKDRGLLIAACVASSAAPVTSFPSGPSLVPPLPLPDDLASAEKPHVPGAKFGVKSNCTEHLIRLVKSGAGSCTGLRRCRGSGPSDDG